MTKQQESRLGRGLDALLGNQADLDRFRKPIGYVNKEIAGPKAVQNTSDIVRIPVEMIEPNPYQPRKTFAEEALSELADSIRTLGLIQPITVRRVSADKYQIISGERRFKACRMAGMDMIPSYIRQADSQGMLEMAIVENIQRENLDPIETAMSYQRLIDECNLTQEQMAERVSKKRVSVTNSLRLLRLPVKVQHDLKAGLISVGHAKVILGATDPLMQERLCDITVAKGLSVRQLENVLHNELSQSTKTARSANPQMTDDLNKVLGHIGKYFDSEISVKRNASGKGTMTIHFDNDGQIALFLEALDKAGI